jgi:hypothetical protein
MCSYKRQFYFIFAYPIGPVTEAVVIDVVEVKVTVTVGNDEVTGLKPGTTRK